QVLGLFPQGSKTHVATTISWAVAMEADCSKEEIRRDKIIKRGTMHMKTYLEN
ncbi:hypothetical protein KI387_000182, partial [Taxus chinensis]